MNDLDAKAEFFVSEANRRLIRSKEPYLDTERKKLIHLSEYYDREYHLDKAKKFYYVRDNYTNPSFT